MKCKKTAALLGLGLSLVLFLSSCGKSEDQPDLDMEANGGEGQILTEEEGILYENPEFGIALTFPKEWEGLYSLRVRKEYIVARTEWNGVLFDLARTPGDLIEDAEDLGKENAEILFTQSGYTYYVTYPEEPQWQNEEEREIYDKLAKNVPDILESANPLETERPKGRSEGYELVGTSYFEVEIPDNWTLTNSENPYQWDILSSEDSTVGWFRLIPYEEGLTKERTGERDGKEAWIAWRSDGNTERTVEFAFFVRQNSRDLGLSIIDTLKFRNGKYNSIDVLTAANLYQLNGSDLVSGKIVSIEDEPDGAYLLTTEILTMPARAEAGTEPGAESGTAGADPASGAKAESESKLLSYLLEDPKITDGSADAPGKVLQRDEFIKSVASGKYDNQIFDFIVSGGIIQAITGHQEP